MENAAEALKMAGAVLIFIIAMSVAFMMITLTRSTADTIFATTDKQEYVDNITAMVQTGDENRVVGLDTIIPTIYRYAQENYGVTIIDNGNIVALYDLQVENTVSSISTTWEAGKASEDKLKELASKINAYTSYVDSSYTYSDEEYRNLFRKIYLIKKPNSYSCPWTSSTYNIMKRIGAEMEGSVVYFGDETNRELEHDGRIFGANQGFINKYKNDVRGDTFKEYYYTVKERNPLNDEEETTKLQIIYEKIKI